MKKNLFWLAAVVLSGAMVSCSSSEEESVDLGEAKTVVNMLSEAQPIQLTEAQRVFANDNNRFTLNFLKTVNEADQSGKSFIYSPLSITYVLGMVNDAATGETERELEQTLGFHEGGIKAVNDYCKKLIEGLPKVDEMVTLNIANAIFVNKDYTLKEHMIPTILDEVDPMMVSYLLNAIYFKADWASKFDQKNTKEETFTTESGKTKLPLMHQNVLINYFMNDTYCAIEMPYGNGFWNMTVMLPEEGKTTDDIINRLANIGFLEGRYLDGGPKYSNYSPFEVDLKLPRYETDSDTDKLEGGLVRLMQKMGIKLAFDSYLAEIPNMCEWPVYIDMMRQKAKIKVNEDGSEAAAVTVAGIQTLSMAHEPIEYPKATFHANRPFVYVIREASSGVILFVGKFTGA